MTQIKVIFIFAPMNTFSQEDLERVRKIVGEEYSRQFGCAADAVTVVTDGMTKEQVVDHLISFIRH